MLNQHNPTWDLKKKKKKKKKKKGAATFPYLGFKNLRVNFLWSNLSILFKLQLDWLIAIASDKSLRILMRGDEGLARQRNFVDCHCTFYVTRMWEIQFCFWGGWARGKPNIHNYYFVWLYLLLGLQRYLLFKGFVKSKARMNDFPEDNLNRFSPHIYLSTALLL